MATDKPIASWQIVVIDTPDDSRRGESGPTIYVDRVTGAYRYYASTVNLLGWVDIYNAVRQQIERSHPALASTRVDAQTDLIIEFSSGRQREQDFGLPAGLIDPLAVDFVSQHKKHRLDQRNMMMHGSFDTLQISSQQLVQNAFSAIAYRDQTRVEAEDKQTMESKIKDASNDLVRAIEQIAAKQSFQRTTYEDTVYPLPDEFVPGYEKAVESGQRSRTEIYEGKEMLTRWMVAQHLKTSEANIDLLREQGRLLALKVADRPFVYPDWQFAQDLADSMPAVLDALGALDSWQKYLFLIQPNELLNVGSAIDALRAGKANLVIEVATSYREIFS